MSNAFSAVVETNAAAPQGLHTALVETPIWPGLILTALALVILFSSIVGVRAARNGLPIVSLGVLRIALTLTITAALATAFNNTTMWLLYYATTEPSSFTSTYLTTTAYWAIMDMLKWILLIGFNIIAIQVIHAIRRTNERKTADSGVDSSIGGES
jgi:hypothetical protein